MMTFLTSTGEGVCKRSGVFTGSSVFIEVDVCSVCTRRVGLYTAGVEGWAGVELCTRRGGVCVEHVTGCTVGSVLFAFM